MGKINKILNLEKERNELIEMWKKIRDNTSQYDRGSDVLNLIYDLEQKYFPKEKPND